MILCTVGEEGSCRDSEGVFDNVVGKDYGQSERDGEPFN